MESYDKFVRKHCCKLSPSESLKTGFYNRGQFRDALYEYRNVSLQRDFGGVGMTTKSISELAQRVLQPEPEPIQTTSISLPTNYTHRPQQLQAVVTPSEGEISEVQGTISARINIDETIADQMRELEVIKKDKSGSSSGASGPVSQREKFLEDQLVRNKITQKALIEREEMALGELEEAEQSARKAARERDIDRESRVRGMKKGDLREWIKMNWESGPEISKLVEGRSRTAVLQESDPASYLLDVLGFSVDSIYMDTIGFQEEVGVTEPRDPVVQREIVFGGEGEEETLMGIDDMERIATETETVVESPDLQRQPSLTDPLTETQQRMVDMAEELQE